MTFPPRFDRARARPACAALILFAVLAAASPPRAQTHDPSAFKGWRVSSLSIAGVDGDRARALQSGLALAQTGGLLVKGRPTFFPDLLHEDLSRCRLYLARAGHPYARVTPRFAPDRQRESVAITLEVAPGPAVIVSSLKLNGVPPDLAAEAQRRVRLVAGQPFADPSAESSADAVRDLLREAGYARAEVSHAIEWLDSTNVDVRFDVDAGAVHFFGRKIVEGTSGDLVPLVEKTIEARQGDRFSPSAVQRSRNNLRLLDLFRQVRLQTRASGAGDTLDVVADLIGREPRVVEAGLGYWTDDLLRVRARWMHRNLFRRGRGLTVGATGSKFVQTGNVSSWWPAFIGSRTRAGTSLELERHDEDSYELLRTGVDVFLTHQHSLRVTVRAGVEVSNLDLEVSPDASDEVSTDDGLLTVFSLRWGRDSSDDRLQPTRGTISWILGQWAPAGVLSDNHFVSLEASGTAYRSIARGTVIAVRARAGAAEPIGESVNLLPNTRFFSGGASSMRGFKRRRLGPKDDSGDPIGGEVKLEAAAELRFPLVWRLRGALFVDAGQVWDRSNDVDLGDVAAAVGPGLRLATPVGPIRVDFGYRATDVDTDEPRWVFHLTIGPSF